MSTLMRWWSLCMDAYRASFGGQDMEAARRVLQSLSSRAVDRAVSELERSDQGWELLWLRPSLHAALAERGPHLPAGTLGAETWTWIQSYGLGDAPGYTMTPEGETDRRWLIRRWGIAHDLWHVLTGYGPDAAGEALLSAWTAGALRDGGNALFAAAALVARVPGISRWRWLREMWRAWRAGCAAREVIEQPYEDLLRCNVRLVRARLGMPDPLRVHPQGIPIGPYWGGSAA